jgi:23S rRNA (uracil1939-C5)-methyltransferase
MLQPGSELVLAVDKPVAGGRMLARHNGEIVFLSGTLPGEVVRAKVKRVGRGVAHATTVEIITPSPDRRSVITDPACGGSVYAHIEYKRQLTLKAEVIADALRRIARLPAAPPVPVAASPERGYRMRARLHVCDGVIGFFREGTHDLCDAGATGQLLPETADLITHLSFRLRGERVSAITSIDLAENLNASERGLHLDWIGATSDRPCASLFTDLQLTGVSASTAGAEEAETVAGTPFVTDVFSVPAARRGSVPVTLRRHARAFFQANRFLLPRLLSRVIELVPPGPAVDLYAGVGMFAVSLAAAGREPVSAVEGDQTSAADLRENAKPYGSVLRVFASSVERFMEGQRRAPEATLILDPPRTGMSREAAAGVMRLKAPYVVFVSCDVATFARDIRRLLDAGYELESLEALDLFPNTAHVEVLAVLASAGGTPRESLRTPSGTRRSARNSPGATAHRGRIGLSRTRWLQ